MRNTNKCNNPYDPHEEADLEKARALDSSLWEALALQNHHVHGVAALAKSLQQEAATASGKMRSEAVVLGYNGCSECV